MDICKLKPDHNTCCSCIDTKIDTGGKVDCDSCPECSWVRILSLGRTIFGRDYAYITGPSTDWKIQKVDIKRIGVYTYVKDIFDFYFLLLYYKSDNKTLLHDN